MAFCGHCGAQLQEGMGFCSSCGGQVGVPPAKNQSQQYQQPPQAPPPQYQQQQYQQYPQLTPEADARENRFMAILAYVLFFVPLIVGAHKTSPFVKFHANQGTILFITAVVWNIAMRVILSILTSFMFSGFGWGIGLSMLGITSALFSLLSWAPVVFLIIGIINANTGKMQELPLIGKFTIVK